ncbi:beta-galactosidase [Phytohabitans flavus]|uniref:beta-galactosidase n=1 Tax=Phytohabitans flavus TaxID=1076124 RepID=UPI002F9670B1
MAIAWGAASWWALQGPGLPWDGIDYLAEVRAAHRALWRVGITADFVSLDRAGPLPYQLLVLPAHYLMSDAAAAAVRTYVDGGGRLVATYLSGVADEYGRVRLGGYPGALREVLGVRVEEFRPTPDGWAEDVHLAGAVEVRPGVTRHRFGAGTAWYVSSPLGDGVYGKLLAEAAGIPVREGAAELELVRRRDRHASWLFAFNHGTSAREVEVAGTDLMTGTPVEGTVEVSAGGWAVIRET